MKLTPFLAGIPAVWLVATAFSAPLPADSHISAVTVYSDRAVITRAAGIAVPAAGPVEVVFEKLPATLLDQSLQVTGRGTAQTTLLDVTARAVYVDFTPNERIRSLEDELRGLIHQDHVLEDRATVLEQQRDYVLRIQSATTTPGRDSPSPAVPADAWLKLLAFTDDQLNKIVTERQAIDDRRDELKAKRTMLEQQLNELRGHGGRSYKTVVVRLDAATAGTLDLTLRYTEPDASWTPGYDARVTTAGPAVKLSYFGFVRQNSGEDWRDVDLTLSTARPSLGGAAPELQPWILRPRTIEPLAARNVRKAQFMAELAGRDREPASAGGLNQPMGYDLAYAPTVIETHATSATFHVPAGADIPADNAPHKVGITTVALVAKCTHQTTPKLLPVAFLSASVTNSSDYPLLAGAMNIFLDDALVASSALRTVMPGEKFDLALGADEGIAVKRRLDRRFTEDTGLVTKGTRITYDFTITVQNNRRTPEQVVVNDLVPVSRHEKIVVRLLEPEDLKPDASGFLQWNLALKPGEKRELPLKFSIEYPNDLPVSGVD